MGSIYNFNIYNLMKKSIYQHIADTYKDTMPTPEQVTAVIMERIPNIYSPNQTFEELSLDIYNNYLKSWTY